MNRLNNTITYLVGAMEQLKDHGQDWRLSITPKLKSFGVNVINPCDKPTEKGIEGPETQNLVLQYRKEKRFDLLKKTFKEIRAIDLRFVDLSHFLICKLDLSVHTCGTYEEIFLSNRQKKPIIIFGEKKEKYPGWLFGTLPHELFFETENDVLNYLSYINSSESIDSLGRRWVFLDWNKM